MRSPSHSRWTRVRGVAFSSQHLADLEMRDLAERIGALVEHRAQRDVRARDLPARSAATSAHRPAARPWCWCAAKAWRMAPIADCGTAIRMSPPRPSDLEVELGDDDGRARGRR